MADYRHGYSEAETTNSTNTYQQKLRVTTANLAAGDYRIGYSVEVSNTRNSKGTQIRIQIDDTTTIAEFFKGHMDQAEHFIGLSGFAVVTLTSGVHTIDLDFLTVDVVEAASVRRARIEIHAVP